MPSVTRSPFHSSMSSSLSEGFDGGGRGQRDGGISQRPQLHV